MARARTRTAPAATGPLTVQELGAILREEFDRDDWGTVDPWYFSDPPRADAEEGVDDMQGLYEVMERVVARLNARNGR